jgi:hypothetical protein
LFVAVCFAASPLGTAAADTVFDHPADAAQLARDLAPAIATLRDARTLRGTYTQKKILHEVPRPLLAEGTFLFARDVGIAWRTVKPFSSELVITRRAILQRDRGGASSQLSAERQPAVRTVAEVFFAVFALDFAALEPLFELYSRRAAAAPGASAGGLKVFSMTPAAGWELGLRPKAGLGGAIRQITVGGRRHVERVWLSEVSGDEADIRLRDTVASGEALSAEEQQRFSP